MKTPIWPAIRIDFSIHPPAEAWDSFCALMAFDLDSIGMEEAAVGPGEVVKPVPPGALFYFPAVEDFALAAHYPERAREIADNLFDPGTWSIALEEVKNQDWGVLWREYFHLMRVGDRVHVAPPWENKLPADAPGDSLLILIEPGQAFGTGSHETTQLCLRVLEKAVRQGDNLLDVGTGSGILSFAHLLLGGAFAIGAENDAVCEENFHLNLEHNGLRGRAVFLLGDDPAQVAEMAAASGHPAPTLVVCNMLSEQFLPVLESIRSLGCRTIFSGFLMSEERRVRQAVEEQGFSISESFELQEWGAYVCDPV